MYIYKTSLGSKKESMDTRERSVNPFANRLFVCMSGRTRLAFTIASSMNGVVEEEFLPRKGSPPSFTSQKLAQLPRTMRDHRPPFVHPFPQLFLLVEG